MARKNMPYLTWVKPYPRFVARKIYKSKIAGPTLESECVMSLQGRNKK